MRQQSIDPASTPHRLRIDSNPCGHRYAPHQEFPGTEIITHVADVTDPTSLQAAFATPLDGGRALSIVSNNAGIGGADWEKTLAVDLSAVIMGTSMGLARFKKEAAGGVIVNVAR